MSKPVQPDEQPMIQQHGLQQMSAQQQQIWWSAQAQRALIAYDLEQAACDWMGYTHNAVFAVHRPEGRAVLRLKIIAGDQIIGERAEAHFLRQLHAETDLIAPFPLPVHGDDLVLLDASLPDGSSVTISAVLFAYIEGQSPQPDNLSLKTLRLIGQYLAALHTYGQRYHDPHEGSDDNQYALLRNSPQFPPPAHTYSFYQLNPAAEALFSADQQAILAEVGERVTQVMTVLGTNRAVFGVIHGDMLLKNIIIADQGLGALDFEYFGWGYHIYDLTPLLWQLKPLPDYEQRAQALCDGYVSVRPLSQQELHSLETFIAGRQAASMRWIVANRNNPHVAGKVETILAQRAEELRQFLITGHLGRQ